MGATEHDLRAFDFRHHVYLPPDFREYLALCNSLSYAAGGEFPHNWLGLIEFWSLDVISVDHDGGAGESFGFADYLIDSHQYVIRLTADATKGGLVGVGDTWGIDAPLAESFSDFIELYLQDPDRVLLHS